MSGKRTRGRGPFRKNPKPKPGRLNRIWGAHNAFSLRLKYGSMRHHRMFVMQDFLKKMYTQSRVTALAYPSHPIFAKVSIPT